MHFAHVLETDPAILDYVTNPRLVGMAEEVVGGVVRLSESEAIINSRDPDTYADPEPKYNFHFGTRPPHGTYTGNGLFHSNFVKTLTNLTELGPDDGGTVVIAGSHKIALPMDDIVACVYEDRSLIHQVVAPAGSTVLFAESLIHATGQIRSNRERTIIITGYTPPMFKADTGQEPSPEFLADLPEHVKDYLVGRQQWSVGSHGFAPCGKDGSRSPSRGALYNSCRLRRYWQDQRPHPSFPRRRESRELDQ